MKHDFDALVVQMNEWLLTPRGWRWWINGFLRGMMWMGPEPHPIYGREDLTPTQKDIIGLASDIERVKRDLEEAKPTMSQQEYEQCVYIRSAMYQMYRDWFYGNKSGCTPV